MPQLRKEDPPGDEIMRLPRPNTNGRRSLVLALAFNLPVAFYYLTAILMLVKDAYGIGASLMILGLTGLTLQFFRLQIALLSGIGIIFLIHYLWHCQDFRDPPPDSVEIEAK